MESRFEYLNITPCCLFVLGIFKIKGIKTQTKILFNHLNAYVGLQQTCTTFYVLKVFEFAHLFLSHVNLN